MNYLSKIKNENIQGKTCLLRVDFNIKSLKDTYRINAVLPTIKFLLSKKARVIILSHRGRPNGQEQILSLKPVADILSSKLKKEVKFIPTLNFKKIKEVLAQNQKQQIFFLENLRFLSGEENNDTKLGQELANLGNVYVNDAFAVCHRKNASVVAITKYIKSYVGLLLEKEIAGLNKATKKPKQPLVVILGGSKMVDKIEIIRYLDKKTKYFLFGSYILNEISNLKIQNTLNKKCVLPIDYIKVGNSYFDIGPKTAAKYQKIIKTARTVIWNGPLGMTEEKKYSTGTSKIALAVTKTEAFTVVGGGETASFILKRKLQNKISLLSTGGGAMLDFLVGKKLPGIEALK